MNVEVIAVGTELLLGQIANTNGQFISDRLAYLGYNCYFHTVVGDNEERILSVIKQAASRADILLFTGGLGPTNDDITKEVVAKFIGCELVYDEPSLEKIYDHYRKTNRTPADNNKKQALKFAGGEAFFNETGMAPGVATQANGKTFILLPGPPKEMRPMFAQVEAYLAKVTTTDGKIYSRELKFFGIGESQLEAELIDIINKQTNPTIAPLATDGEVKLRITAKHTNEQEAMKLIDDTEKVIVDIVGEYLYGHDKETLDGKVIHLLKEQNLTLASAESITGGLFGHVFTEHSGVSSIYQGGIICYQNNIKQQVLGVQEDTLRICGAVSENCAKEMAKNVAQLFGSQIGVSFTGVAGPSQLENKPVGTVYIGIYFVDKIEKVIPLQLAGTREQIKSRSVKAALSALMKLLENKL